MNLEEIGAFLKTEREKRGLTIDNVAARLKINPRLLIALESGNAQGLPHQAYVRGFIRSYAGLLGIGREEIQALLEGALPQSQPEPETAMPETAKRGSRGGGGFPAAIIILAGIGCGCWWLWQSGYINSLLELKKEQPAGIEARLPGADAYLAAKAARDAQKREEDKAWPEPARQAEPQAGAPESAAQANAPRVEETPPAPEPAKQAEPAQHKLIITAVEECWVHSNADKTDTRQFSLRKGDTFALTFSKSLELKLGNAGGVRLRYDGSDLPAPGTSGQVKTIVFPPGNSGN